jgi:hypothetical protein
MVGVSKDLLSKIPPVNGLRHKPQGLGSGWFFWTGGEIPTDPDYFQPMHVEHLYLRFPELIKYLALEPRVSCPI